MMHYFDKLVQQLGEVHIQTMKTFSELLHQVAAPTCQNSASLYKELLKDIIGFYPAKTEQKSQRTNKILKHIYIGNGKLSRVLFKMVRK